MRKFTDNDLLINSVQNNDISEIKRLLIDNIFFLQGNHKEINEAIEYTIKNSSFSFDTHIPLSIENTENKFSEEKYNMRENYSRERYNILVRLYNETFAQNTYTYETKPTTNNNNVAKVVAIGVAVAVAVYVLYKILD